MNTSYVRMNPLRLGALLLLLTTTAAHGQSRAVVERKGPPLVNQAGYNLHEAKRVVVPGAPDGTPFQVRRFDPPAPGALQGEAGPVVFDGTIEGYAGDFTDFNPEGGAQEYVVTVPGHGRSYPFRIADHLMETLSSRMAYQFFIDVRGAADHDTFDPVRVAGGGPSRDGGAYTLETVFEVLLYASNPALFDRWTDDLPPDATPDLIDLILWHARFAYDYRDYNGPTGYRPYTLGYEGRPEQTYDYQNTLDHLAAFLAAYPVFLKPYASEETYRRYREATLRLWEPYDRHKVVRRWVNSRKWIDIGREEFNEMGNALGQSVLRNLLMALAEERCPDGDPERFYRYAHDAAAEIIRIWDFENPRHTWLHRNAEHIGPQALAYFLMVAPAKAPAGTREKLAAWRDYILTRTDNLWHYRTHSDAEWAHPKSKEVGTVAGLGGAMFAVAHVLGDAELRRRAWSQVNYVFGQNPVGAHLSHRSPEREEQGGYWPGVERGWPDAYPHGAGDLALVRGALDGSPLDAAFPYNPEGYAGLGTEKAYATEGWAVTNRAWMSTLTFSTLASHEISLLDAAGRPAHRASPGDSVRVRLQAALNRHPAEVERGWVNVAVTSPDGEVVESRLPLRETGPDTGFFEGTLHLGPYPESGDDHLRVAPEDRVRVSYGYLGFTRSATLEVN